MPQVSHQWRSFEQLMQDPAFLARVAQEFPNLTDALTTPQDRRRTLKLMAAALALGGLGGCDAGAPSGSLIPAVRAPANIIPGLPNFYSTANVHCGYASGVVIKHWMGRPIKVEGNPNHPASLGATDVFAQAQLLDFYDPERAWEITRASLPTDRASLERAIAQQRDILSQSRGRGFVVLMGAVTSPTLVAQLGALQGMYPEARCLHWEPISRSNVTQGGELAYGKPVEATPLLEQADVVLAIDSDLLSSAPGHLRYARDFAARRNPTRTRKMNRLYAIEATPTLTGSVADHRFVVEAHELTSIVMALAAGVLSREGPEGPGWLTKIVADLKANMGRAVIHVGPDQSPEIHALAHAMNEALGGRGKTFELLAPVARASTPQFSLGQLLEDMRAGKIGSLLVIESNPVFATSQGPGFAEALRRVDFSLTLATTPTETSDATLWAVPMAHAWESWSDARAYNGVATILQPQAVSLYGGMETERLLGLFAGPDPPKSFDLVQATWRPAVGTNFEDSWREALAAGVVPDTAEAKVDAKLRADLPSLTPPSAPGLTLLLRPDPQLWDGRYADNAWLQELPRPLTKLTWDNPLLISPGRASQMQLQNGDRIRLSVGDASTTTPVWIMPGQADDCVVALLGFGRTRIGEVGRDVGKDFFPFADQAQEPTLEKAPGRTELASTEHHHPLYDDSGVYARSGPLAEFLKDERFLASQPEEGQSFYRWKPEGPAAWGMSIDLNACIGCSACVVACQAENNIPVVGKSEVLCQREMHWLRIDRYYQGAPENPQISYQPVLCMHCEQAPCETVCPVGATMHDSEGLNVMVYNRCIGTRFCSNNCPYKVRRFNYFDFAEAERRAIESRNPDVTVRARGVMEKCTFCIQRIAEARVAADRENRPVAQVITACQAACPTQALTFGNLAEHESEVASRKRSPLTYSLLPHENTKPRVTYEARILNPNPSIAEPLP
jgi:MoCo/4Fe-4S cofactor protein with predicted Tat translocation signal